MPAPSGLWASRACYPIGPMRHWRGACPMREIPLANLCNRLVVTSTLGVTPFPSFGLSPSCSPRSSSCFRLGGIPVIGPRPTSTPLDGHRWRPQPWVGHAVGAAPASCYPTITPMGIRGVPRQSPSGRCRPCSHSMIRLADAPCRCPQPVPGIPSRAARARARVPAPQPKGAAVRARGAFHQQVPLPTPELAPERRPRGPPLVPRFCHRGPSFRHAFTPHPRSARPRRLPAIRRGPGATCRLPASAMECPPSTPTCRSIPSLGRGEPRPTR
jgi:hypothetical protein